MGALHPQREITTKGSWDKLDIPEKIIQKLAKTAGLEYVGKTARGGGGLCMGIEGVKPRRKALALLGVLVTRIGEGSTDEALEIAGATWLDVMMWREDSEYSALWDAADRLRDRVVATRMKDALGSRVLEGYDVEEAKKGAGGEIEKVTVRRYDNRLGVQMLNGLGMMNRDIGMRLTQSKKSGVVDNSSSVGKEGDTPDTTLFYDRKTAYEVMGAEVAGKNRGGKKRGVDSTVIEEER